MIENRVVELILYIALAFVVTFVVVIVGNAFDKASARRFKKRMNDASVGNLSENS